MISVSTVFISLRTQTGRWPSRSYLGVCPFCQLGPAQPSSRRSAGTTASMVIAGRFSSCAKVMPSTLGPSRSAWTAAGSSLTSTFVDFRQHCERGGARLFGFVLGPCGVIDQPEPASMRSQALVGVVDAQVQAELRARGEHAVRLVGALGDQVVDQDAGVGLGAVERERGLSPLTASAALMPAIRPWQAASS